MIQDYQGGMAAFVAGRFTDAIEQLERVAVHSNHSLARLARHYLAQAHVRAGRNLFQTRRYSEAAHHFAAAVPLMPGESGLAGSLVRCHIGEQRYELAAADLERMLLADPDSVELRVRLALACFKAGQGWRAIELLRSGIERNPAPAELHYQLGAMLASDGDLITAKTSFENALARDPGHTRALERLAQCCALEGRHERAIRYLEHAHRLDPANARIAWQLSLAADRSGERVELVDAPASSSQDQAALQRLADAILREPEFVETFLSLPPSAVDEEIFGTLAATLQQALRCRPEYADLHYHCGMIQRRLGHADAAVEHAERAVSLNPRYTNALILLAQLYAQTDRCREGVERLEQAIRAGGDYPDIHYMIGRLCQNIGEMTRARLAYQRALELNANYREAREALATLAA